MTYKETLFFVGKSLTMNSEKENVSYITNLIKANKVNWDKVVQLSTKHYVFPALYCNLKRAGIINLLPLDLAEYMAHITQLNRERNLQIIEQAKEVNKVLIDKGIVPIFLKGTALLLQNMYEDIGERMVGDIDFLVEEKHYQNTYTILKNMGYKKVLDTSYDFPGFKHLPRISKKDNIAAIEIHRELTTEGFHKEFNYNTVSKDLLLAENCKVLNYSNQLTLSVIAKQINDKGYLYNDVSLRNAYDVFILSLKTNSLEAVKKYPSLFEKLNSFLALSFFVLSANSIKFEQTKESEKSLKIYQKTLDNARFKKKHYKNLNRTLFLKTRFSIIYKSFANKEYRRWLLKRISDKRWQKEKLIQLGFKKSNL